MTSDEYQRRTAITRLEVSPSQERLLRETITEWQRGCQLAVDEAWQQCHTKSDVQQLTYDSIREQTELNSQHSVLATHPAAEAIKLSVYWIFMLRHTQKQMMDWITRRAILQAMLASSALSAVSGCLSLNRSESEPSKPAKPLDWLDDADDLALYVRGFDVEPPVAAETINEADLAVFEADSVPSHDVIADALTDGIPVAVGGDRPNRALVGALQDVAPSEVTVRPDQSSTLAADLDYSFGYQLPSSPTKGIALVYPTGEILELHTRPIDYETDRQAVNAALGRYHRATEQPRVETIESAVDPKDWRRRGRVSATVEQCPGGRVERLVDCYTNPGEDGLVFWRFRDEMVPGVHVDSHCDGEEGGYNEESLRRMTYGEGHGGTILSFDPSTMAESSDTASADGVDPGESWTYDVSGVTVSGDLNVSEQAIRWEHEIRDESPFTDESFVAEPGILVRYPSATSVATHDLEVEFEFGGDWWTSLDSVEATGSGAWQVD